MAGNSNKYSLKSRLVPKMLKIKPFKGQTIAVTMVLKFLLAKDMFNIFPYNINDLQGQFVPRQLDARRIFWRSYRLNARGCFQGKDNSAAGWVGAAIIQMLP